MENIKDIDRPFRVTCVENGVRFFLSGHNSLDEAIARASEANEVAVDLGLKGVQYEAGPKE